MKYGLYHGCHNTFVITDYLDNVDFADQAKILCKKHYMDGLMVLKKEPLTLIFYNADGSRAPMCGNGIRSFTKYAYDTQVINEINQWYNIETLGGLMKVKITSLTPFTVLVNLGKPLYSSKILEINTPKDEFIDETLIISDKEIKVTSIFLGTHHAIIFINDLAEVTESIAKAICEHEIYTVGTNVNFVKVLDRNNLYVKTYERGVGWTQACGTGTSSAFCVARMFDLVDDKITGHFAGGCIKVWKEKEEIYMEGPAVTIAYPVYEE